MCYILDCVNNCIIYSSVIHNIREVKISLRQRQRVQERNYLCADIIISCVLPVFLFVIVLEDDEMVAMSHSSLCVQKGNQNDNDISMSFSYSLSQ